MQPHLPLKSAIVILIFILVGVPGLSAASEAIDAYNDRMNEYEQEVTTARMAADTLLVRPLGIASTVLGFGIFVVSIPFSALGRNVPEAWNSLVVRPAKFTFARPLGAFDRAAGSSN